MAPPAVSPNGAEVLCRRDRPAWTAEADGTRGGGGGGSARRLGCLRLDTYHLGRCSSQRMCFTLQVPQLRGRAPFVSGCGYGPWSAGAKRAHHLPSARSLMGLSLALVGPDLPRHCWGLGEWGDRPMRSTGTRGSGRAGYLTTSRWQSAAGPGRVRTHICNRYARSRAASSLPEDSALRAAACRRRPFIRCAPQGGARDRGSGAGYLLAASRLEARCQRPPRPHHSGKLNGPRGRVAPIDARGGASRWNPCSWGLSRRPSIRPCMHVRPTST